MDWFISDTHFGHKNIIDYETRPFRDCAEMEEILIKNWNDKVKKEDRVFHLGDLSFYPKDPSKHIVEQLQGRIHLIMGNHDTHSPGWYREIGVAECSQFPIVISRFVILSHEPMYLNKISPYRNIHGHIHSNFSPTDKHFNVSVEVINYAPVSIDEIASKFKFVEVDRREDEYND